ncbi:MAG: hypothetical protein AB1847_17680, partial [bacterium]
MDEEKKAETRQEIKEELRQEELKQEELKQAIGDERGEEAREKQKDETGQEQKDGKTQDRPKLYLIDGNSYIYRAFYAIPHLSTSKGTPTSAIYGFVTMLLRVIKEDQPNYLAVAFDAKGPTFRHESFSVYKCNRPQMPDDLVVQIPS